MGNFHSINGKESVTFWRRAAAAVGLSLFFVLVYGGTNNLAGTRENVGSIYFSWERFTPFVPWLIVPYMSIDAFFFLAPFLCRTKEELRTLSTRIISGILIAGFYFLIIPLTLVSRPAPETAGIFAPIFRFLHGFDNPYNLFPSMHVILRTILAYHYYQWTKGWKKAAVAVWFSLIGFSTVLTYQHHIIDIIGGFGVAIVIFYVIRDRNHKMPVVPNPRIGYLYLLAAIGCVTIAFALQGWFYLLLWPWLTTTLIATAYWGIGPAIIGKAKGRIPFSAKVVLLPYILGQWLSRYWYLRRTRFYDRVCDGVLLGAVPTRRQCRKLTAEGVVAILDMTAEFDSSTSLGTVAYLNLPVLDLTAPTDEYLRQAADFIAKHVGEGDVYVHCKIGFSRSAAAVASYLMLYQQKSYDESLALIRSSRPEVVIRPEIRESLKALEKTIPSHRLENDEFGQAGCAQTVECCSTVG